MSKEATIPGDRAIARIYERDMDLFASRKARDERYGWKARVVASAIEKKKSGYTPVISDEATAFVDHYYLHTKAWPRLQMAESKPRPAGSTWISFRPEALPRGAVIEHLVTAGEVRVMFYGAAEKLDTLRAQLSPYLEPSMVIRQAGKSVAVSARVPPIPAITVPFAQVQGEAEEAMRAADALAGMMATARAAGVRL